MVVDFWASWCGRAAPSAPRSSASPESMGDDVDLVKVDVDANQELSRAYGIQGFRP